ncbi:MAG: alpha/beta hydrolase [Planctomyces sp.]|nr:alpha/beta hydrolase [Planctomyces sp.]
MTARWKESLISVEGHQIATRTYNMEKSGPLVVFFHGITSSVGLWPTLLGGTRLLTDARCLSVSLPGHWPSTAPSGLTTDKVSAELFARTLRAAIDFHDSECPVHLAGWSTGGFASLVLAADVEFRDRVLSVACFSGFARGKWHSWLGIWQHLAAWKIHRISFYLTLAALRSMTWLHVAVMARFLGRPSDPGLRRALSASAMHAELKAHNGVSLQAMMGGIRSIDLTSHLIQIECPVFVVAGECDPVIRISEARHIADHIQNSELVVLPGVGHMLPVEAPETMVRTIEMSIQSVRPKA